MNWWLIYGAEDAKRNLGYIQMYFEACERRNITLTLVIEEEFSLVYSTDGLQFYQKTEELQRPDVVINRSRNYTLSKQLEIAGISVYNNSFVTLLGNDKTLCGQYVASLGVPVMKTYSGQQLPEEYPYILKTRDGHGGTEVFKIDTEADYQQALEQIGEKPYLVQEVAKDLGRDLRVYIVGNQIVKGMLRISENDFRSNYCLGGRCEAYTFSKEEEEMIEKILNGFTFGMVGMDFIFNDGKLIFNELEDVVGARMLYGNTEIDIVELYVNHIYNEIEIK